MKRERYRSEFKARVAPEAIKGQKTAGRLGWQCGVHVSEINS